MRRRDAMANKPKCDGMTKMDRDFYDDSLFSSETGLESLPTDR